MIQEWSVKEYSTIQEITGKVRKFLAEFNSKLEWEKNAGFSFYGNMYVMESFRICAASN